MNIRKYILAFSITAVAALLFSGCNRQNNAAMQRPAPEVDVALPIKKSVELWDEYTARIDGEQSVEIRARVSGYLEKKCFKDGEYVKKGQTLFLIDARPFKAVVAAAKASVQEAESRVVLAEGNYARAAELFKSNAISKEVLDTRNADLLMSKANLSLAKANLVKAELDLEFTTIVSPVSGYVSRRYVDEGNLISASSTLLAKVISRDTVYVYFEASERDAIKYLNEGTFNNMKNEKIPVKIKLMGEKNFGHKGVLSYVGNSLNTLNLELRADIDNSDKKLMPGMYAKAAMLYNKNSQSLLVPEEAVGTDLVGRYVMTVDEKNIARYTPVNVGELLNGQRIIRSGLNGTEKVVVNGLQRAVPNTVVSPKLVELK